MLSWFKALELGSEGDDRQKGFSVVLAAGSDYRCPGTKQ